MEYYVLCNIHSFKNVYALKNRSINPSSKYLSSAGLQRGEGGGLEPILNREKYKAGVLPRWDVGTDIINEKTGSCSLSPLRMHYRQ